MNALIDALADIVFPRSCAGCGQGVEGAGGYICWNCMAQMEWVGPPFCRICGDPLYGEAGFEVVCKGCSTVLPFFERARSVARLRGALRATMHAFKYNGATWLARDLATLMLACYELHFSRAGFDTVTFVPLYPSRERERSYNQAFLLARRLAEACPSLELRRCLRRVRETPSQTHLTAVQRLANVRSAFSVEGAANIKDRRILLVDDIMTTGATVNECARVLKRSGAALVGVLTVGRG